MKKFFSTILVLVVGLGLTAGFIMEDPFGSKTNTTDSRQPVSSPGYVSYGTPVYTDNFDDLNDTTALKARGYKPYYRGTGPQGVTATWYQGSTAVFNAYNGPATGYVAANYNVVTGANNIDSWLVLPRVAGGTLAGDSLYFYCRSNTGSTYPDSVRVMYSTNDSIPEGTWVELGRFKTNTTTGWERKGFRAPTASVNGRFAIRYCVANGGPSGTNSDYMGIDALTIERSGGPSPLTYPTTICSYGTLPASPVSRWATANAILGDTLYITGGYVDGATTGSTNVQRYNINTNTFSVGTPLPTGLAGHSLVKAGNALYLMGGGSTVSTAGTLCYKYTPATGWTPIAPLPAGKAGHGAANWGDSVIFVIGGPYSTPNTTVYYYRVATDTWGTSTPNIVGRRTAAYGIVGNKLFIMGGYNAAFTKNVQIGTIGANATTITWAAGPDIPLRAGALGSSRPGGVGLGDRFYFVTGELTPAPTTCDSIYMFDAVGNTWMPTILTGRGPTGASSNYWEAVDAFVTGSNKGKILIAGGSLTGATNPGLYTIQVDICSVTNIGNLETPANYSLSQNYPNPFNPVTKISFALPKSGLVTMKVYDILGKEVATLVNEVKNAGSYSVDFNASNLTSGMYFYKVSVNGFSEVKKMMLIK